MELGIAGRRAVVTAASRGIGRAAALALAAEGARVAICARGKADLKATLDAMGGEHNGHSALAVDLMASEGPRQLIELLRLQDDPIELVVHNIGGTGGVREPLPEIERWRDVFRLNVEIAAELNSALIPPMVERKDGRIVFVSSLAAFEHHGSLAYGVAKAALTAYARGLGRTYAADGLVISAVVPGVVLSEGGHWEQNLRQDPAYVEQYVRERLPRGTFGTPEEVGSAVAFLCSRQATAFVGSIVPLEGGQGRSYFGQ